MFYRYEKNINMQNKSYVNQIKPDWTESVKAKKEKIKR